MTTDEEVAVCTQCFRQKPIGKFPACAGWASGRSPRCSACRNSGEVWPAVADLAVLHVCGTPLDEEAHATLKEAALRVSAEAAEGFPLVSRADIWPLVFRNIRWYAKAGSGLDGALAAVARFQAKAERLAGGINRNREKANAADIPWTILSPIGDFRA